MNEIRISDKISYIEAAEDPLSADVGIVRSDGGVWLFDVGNGENRLPSSGDGYRVVLSHFHPDHTGNLDKIPLCELYVSRETQKHVKKGTLVTEDLYFGSLHVFPIPSSHAKGCLGLEVDGTYAFVGDALYCTGKKGRYVYNAQLLKDEINVLKKLRAPYLLVSHHKGLVRSKEDVIAELRAIYESRTANDPEIEVQ